MMSKLTALGPVGHFIVNLKSWFGSQIKEWKHSYNDEEIAQMMQIHTIYDVNFNGFEKLNLPGLFMDDATIPNLLRTSSNYKLPSSYQETDRFIIDTDEVNFTNQISHYDNIVASKLINIIGSATQYGHYIKQTAQSQKPYSPERRVMQDMKQWAIQISTIRNQAVLFQLIQKRIEYLKQIKDIFPMKSTFTDSVKGFVNNTIAVFSPFNNAIKPDIKTNHISSSLINMVHTLEELKSYLNLNKNTIKAPAPSQGELHKAHINIGTLMHHHIRFLYYVAPNIPLPILNERSLVSRDIFNSDEYERALKNPLVKKLRFIIANTEFFQQQLIDITLPEEFKKSVIEHIPSRPYITPAFDSENNITWNKLLDFTNQIDTFNSLIQGLYALSKSAGSLAVSGNDSRITSDTLLNFVAQLNSYENILKEFDDMMSNKQEQIQASNQANECKAWLSNIQEAKKSLKIISSTVQIIKEASINISEQLKSLESREDILTTILIQQDNLRKNAIKITSQLSTTKSNDASSHSNPPLLIEENHEVQLLAQPVSHIQLSTVQFSSPLKNLIVEIIQQYIRDKYHPKSFKDRVLTKWKKLSNKDDIEYKTNNANSVLAIVLYQLQSDDQIIEFISKFCAQNDPCSKLVKAFNKVINAKPLVTTSPQVIRQSSDLEIPLDHNSEALQQHLTQKSTKLADYNEKLQTTLKQKEMVLYYNFELQEKYDEFAKQLDNIRKQKLNLQDQPNAANTLQQLNTQEEKLLKQKEEINKQLAELNYPAADQSDRHVNAATRASNNNNAAQYIK